MTKPVHLATVGLLVGTIVAPVAAHLYENEQYRLSDAVQAVAENPSPHLMSKLKYDAGKKASIFNVEGAAAVKADAKDQYRSALGAGGKKDNQLYTATLPDDATRGIEISDNVSGVSFKFAPQMSLMNGRTEDGHVVYPMKDQPGHMIFTPKGNGIKEDIVLDRAPGGDVAEFKYSLNLPKYLEARLEDDGSLGFYTGTPELFGNISYGSDKDRANVDRARTNAKKTYLMFKIPAPVIRETGKVSGVAGRFSLSGTTLTVRVSGLKKAHYPIAIDPTFYITSTSDFILGSIDDNIDLSVADQVGRAALGGGSTPSWTPSLAPSLAYAQFAAGLVAYNGYLYLIGGGSNCTTWTNATTCSGSSAATATRDVLYICLNPNTGALGSNGGCTPSAWTNVSVQFSDTTRKLNTARQGLTAFGYNGYLYAVGGEDTNAAPIFTTPTGSAGNHTVEFAKINSDGTIGSWNYTGSLTEGRSFAAGSIYQGVLYLIGGSNGTLNATLRDTVMWARINGDGSIGSKTCDSTTTYYELCTWSISSSAATGNLTSPRNRFRASAYNGYLYIVGGVTTGGLVGAATSTTEMAQYAPIDSDGSPGAWKSLNAFPTPRRDMGMGVNNGYIYVYGGCNQAAMNCAVTSMIADTYYAAINADGTIGQWQRTLEYNYGTVAGNCPAVGGNDYCPRMPGGTTFYSNHLYFIGGCYDEAATTNNHCTSALVGTFITSIDSVGRFDRGTSNLGTPPYTGTSTVAKMGGRAVALNGYMYYIGGCSTSGCGSYDSTVEYAQINADGTMGNLATTTALPAGTGDAAGRMGHSLAAYNNKLYVIGGAERKSSTTFPSVSAGTPLQQAIASSTTHAVTMPGTVSAGDLLVVLITLSSNQTLTPPANWIGGASVTNWTVTQGTGLRGSVYVKKADGTEVGTTPNFSTATAAAAAVNVYRIPASDWYGGNSLGTLTTTNVTNAVAAANFTSGTATANPNPPSLTPTWGSDDNLWIANAGGTYTGVTTLPTNYTNSAHANVVGGVSASSGRRTLTATSEDPGTFTMASSTAYTAFTIAIRPSESLNNTYMTTVLTNSQNTSPFDGKLGATWSTQTTLGGHDLAAARAFHTSEIWHNNIYVIGGRDASSQSTPFGTIYYATIDSSGNIGSWTLSATTITARWGASGGIWGKWMYVVGGQTDFAGTFIGTASPAVEQLTINESSGDVSAVAGTAADVARRFAGGYVDRGILYSFGGDTSGGDVADISRAALNSSTGVPGTFSAASIGNIQNSTAGLATARSMNGAVIYGGYAYTLGGCTSAIANNAYRACTGFVSTANTTEVDLPDNGGTGQLGAFTTGSSNIVNLPTVGGTAGRADHSAVAYNNELYIIGGCRVYTAGACTTGLGDIERADIETDGTVTSSWTAQTSLPGSAVRSGLRAVAYNQHMYVIGGRDSGGTATNTVWYTTIDNTGTLGASWTNADLPVGQERADFGAAISNGYLYVVGGTNASGTRQSTVYLAAINATDGSVGSWTTTTPFGTARSDFSLSAYNGVLYIVGGYSGSATLTDVQYGDIGTSGTIAAWKNTTDVARGARARQAVGANGYMYYLGDEGGTNTNVQYAAINSTGTLGTIQTSPTTMSGAHAHGSAVFYDGFVYITGGCTLSSNVCTTVSAANDKAGQQAVSRTGHYSKLFDTQVDTTPTQLVVGGVDGGPGSLVEFRFYTASTGDPVLGVAQLIRPVIYGNFYNVQALNSSGAFVGQAFQYEYIITLDDSRAGTFPDVPKSGSQTAVTDVTLFYHANPARRLRHGASFTNSGCNDTATIADGCILDTAP